MYKVGDYVIRNKDIFLIRYVDTRPDCGSIDHLVESIDEGKRTKGEILYNMGLGDDIEVKFKGGFMWFGKEHFDKWVPKERDYVVLKSDHPKITYKIIKVFNDGDIALVKGDKPYYSIDEVSPATYSEIRKYVEENPEKGLI